MKKLLSILGAFGLSTVAPVAVVSCGTQEIHVIQSATIKISNEVHKFLSEKESISGVKPEEQKFLRQYKNIDEASEAIKDFLLTMKPEVVDQKELTIPLFDESKDPKNGDEFLLKMGENPNFKPGNGVGQIELNFYWSTKDKDEKLIWDMSKPVYSKTFIYGWSENK